MRSTQFIYFMALASKLYCIVMPRFTLCLGVLILCLGGNALCPLRGDPPAGHPPVIPSAVRKPHRDYGAAVAEVDFSAVLADIKSTVLTNSQEWWPADYGTYAPFFIRLVSRAND